MKVAFLGATKGMGRALARRMAERGEHLCLMGRDAEQLTRSAADLAVRGAAKPVSTAHCDLRVSSTLVSALDRADEALGAFDTLVVTAAAFATQEELETDAALCRDLLTTNFTSVIELCEEARRRMLDRGGGTICVFSSVAGDRARKPVILYGATKAALSYYMEGLDYKFRARGLRAVLVKPGFIKTGMTAALEPPPFAGEPDQVALRVLRAMDRGTPVVYAPPIWRIVMTGICLLPRALMRRIEF